MTNVLQTLIKFILLFISVTSYACDICSCATNNSGGTGLGGNANYVGFSYNFLNFRFKDGVHNNSPYGTDYIHQINVSGQYKLTDKIGLRATVPFQKNIRSTEDDTVNNTGIGDVSISAIYYLLNKESHKVNIGLGVKFPTGDFDYQIATTTNTSALQLGTGSFDYNLPLEYSFSKNKFKTQLRFTYFYKTENQDQFKFGNQTQAQWVNDYQFLELEKSAYQLSLGTSCDLYNEAEVRGSKVLSTDGYLLNASVGVKCNLEQVVLGVNYQFPLSQNIIEEEVTFKKGLSLYAYYSF